jgi:hypothetical protein
MRCSGHPAAVQRYNALGIRTLSPGLTCDPERVGVYPLTILRHRGERSCFPGRRRILAPGLIVAPGVAGRNGTGGSLQRLNVERWNLGNMKDPTPCFSVSVAYKGLRYSVSLLFATLTGMSGCVAFKRLTGAGRWRGGDARNVEKQKAPPTPRAFVRMSNERSCGRGHL